MPAEVLYLLHQAGPIAQDEFGRPPGASTRRTAPWLSSLIGDWDLLVRPPNLRRLFAPIGVAPRSTWGGPPFRNRVVLTLPRARPS